MSDSVSAFPASKTTLVCRHKENLWSDSGKSNGNLVVYYVVQGFSNGHESRPVGLFDPGGFFGSVRGFAWEHERLKLKSLPRGRLLGPFANSDFWAVSNGTSGLSMYVKGKSYSTRPRSSRRKDWRHTAFQTAQGLDYRDHRDMECLVPMYF